MSKYNAEQITNLQKTFIDFTGCYEEDQNWYEPGRAGGVFGSALTIWMMILQGALGKSLSGVLDLLIKGHCDLILKKNERSQKAGFRNISRNTGGYAQARQRISVKQVKEVADLINQGLMLQSKDKGQVYCIDGTIMTLHNNKSIEKAYPKRRNQVNEFYYPELLMVMATGVESGVISKWQTMPAKGGSEQRASVSVIDALPKGSMIMGDRNFGVFSVVSHAITGDKDVLVRLTEARVQKIFPGANKKATIDERIIWEKSRKDQLLVEDDATQVEGRFVKTVLKTKGFQDLVLYFFTTSDITVKELVELYRKRYCVETDIRYLKQMFKLDFIAAKDPQMIEKEIILRICSYNMLRSVIADLASVLKLNPRQISFTRAINCIDTAASWFAKASTKEEKDRVTQQLLTMLRQIKHPNRKKRRVEPRAIRRINRHPFLAGNRDTIYV